MIIGMDEFRRNIDREIANRQEKITRAITAIGNNHVMEGMKRAPIDEGHLRESIEKEVVGPDTCIVRVPLNAPASNYAVAMHEDDYQPGWESRNSGLKAGVHVGRKYLTRGRRAARPNDEKIIRRYLSR